MPELNAVSVIPLITSITDLDDPESIQESYFNTAVKLQQMNLQNEILKLLHVLWLEGSAFGYVYDDDSSFFIHVLDGKYCKISSLDRGVPRFAFDFTYFDSAPADLENWAPEFKKKYNAYLKDSQGMRWQELEHNCQICLKLDMDDPLLSLPPFLPIFELLISLIDLQGIQDVKNELQIIKILVARLETFDNGEPDDWKVNLDLATEYYNLLAESLPPQVAAVISPLPIEPVEFKANDTKEENDIATATNTLFKTSGGSSVLGSDKSGSSIFKAQIISDVNFGVKTVLGQIQRWVNVYLDDILGEDHALVKFIETTAYTVADKKKSLLESGNNGVPFKLAVGALDGYSPLELLSLDYLENKVLKLHESWIPFSTSYTQSGKGTQGAPEKAESELTDEGADTRDEEKNKM